MDVTNCMCLYQHLQHMNMYIYMYNKQDIFLLLKGEFLPRFSFLLVLNEHTQSKCVKSFSAAAGEVLHSLYLLQHIL